MLARCYWQKEKCASLQSMSAAGDNVRRRPRAKVVFQTDDGKAQAWTHNMKLNLQRAETGDKIDILYRGPPPYYVSGPLSHLQAAMGVLVSLLGVILLVLSARWRNETSP